ncbi:acyltransferase family protein [Yoonia sp. 2307UL14-13]|uniref:acyltransferase family protein n=1 Tax=Yoonia sp. 2307UL14-13 TaxID=3126506 RepID=UPI0030EDCE0D
MIALPALKSKELQLTNLNRLRGFAAICVVVGHAFIIVSLRPAQLHFGPIYLLIASATVYFVLIAGILFQIKAVPRLNAGRTRTRDILRRRWAQFSGIYLTIGVFLALTTGIKEGLSAGINPVYHFVRMMINGSMAHSYWFVPFFLLLMALTPLHLWFSRRPLAIQAVLVAVGLALSAITHRPGAYDIYGPIHALGYYLPVFWFGLMIGQNLPMVLVWLKGKEALLAFGVAAIVAMQMQIGQTGVYLHSFGQNLGQIDLFAVQKILLGLLLLSFFDQTKTISMPLIDWVADRSLIIFFMHSPVLIAITDAPHLSDLYFPELILASGIMIYVGVKFHTLLLRVFEHLPDRIKEIGLKVTAGRLSKRSETDLPCRTPLDQKTRSV